MAKILTAIIAEDITYLVEKEQLLPPNHYGGRPGRMTTDAVHSLVDKVKSAWRRGKVVSILYLDVEGAFPNAVTDRLIHNLRRRRIPLVYTRFVEQLLKGRRTRIKFDDYLSDPIQISNGIGQGDPLSMILYIIYNADFLELAIPPIEESLGFVDDAMAMVEGKTFKANVNKLTKFMNRRNGGFKWSQDHNSRFAIDKLAITHFTRKRTPDPQNPRRSIPTPIPAMKLGGQIVRVEPSYKYLGIHVDHQLRWKTQMNEAIAKATKWTLLFRRLTKVASGLSAKLMRRLYITVAIPKMTYGLDVWYTPPNKPEGSRKNTGSVKALKEFGKLQRLATTAINGAFKSSPTDLLDSHSGLLPISLMLKSICYRSIMRICSLPLSNPVSAQAVKYFRNPAKTHKTNIQLLLELYEIDPTIYETIPPVSLPPVHPLPIETYIADNKEEAIEDESKDEANIRIYTDGSSQDGQVGAAAVLYHAQNNTITNPTKILRYQLGTDKEHSVWDAEVVGGILALWLLKDLNRLNQQKISIYTDNQAFIKAFKAQRASKGYHLIKEFTDAAKLLTQSTNPPISPERITLKWIAAHKDVKGNERADTEAKRAAAGETSLPELLPHLLRIPLPRSIGAAKTHYKNVLKEEWQIIWNTSPRKARLEKIDEDFPFNKFRSYNILLTRLQSSLLFQIRSNHLPLNCYLHRIGAAPTKECANCRTILQDGPEETVTHFIFECPTYNQVRQNLDAALGRNARDLKEILSDLDQTRELLKYIGQTRRFQSIGDVARMRQPPPEE
jgi:ribonuclease HI